MGDVDPKLGLLADGQGVEFRDAAVDRDLHGDPILDLGSAMDPGDQLEGHALADDAEARRAGRLQRQVEAVGLAGDQGVNRAGEALEAAGIVDLAVAQQHRAGDLARGDMGGGLVERRQQPCAPVLAAGVRRHLDDAQLQRIGGGGERLDPGPQPFGGVADLGRAVLQRGGFGAVDDQEGDVLQPFAVLALELRPGQRQHQQTQRQGAQTPARQAAPETGAGPQRHQRPEPDDDPPVKLGDEGEGEFH